MPSLLKSSGQTGWEDVQRKQKMADMLAAMAMKQNPQDLQGGGWVAAAAPIMRALAARKAQKRADEGSDEMKELEGQDWQNIMQAMQGTPEKPAQPFMDEQAQFMGQESPQGLQATEAVPAQPGSREKIVQAMMQANNPQLRMAGLEKMMQKEKTPTWKLGQIGAGDDQKRSIFYNESDPSQVQNVGEPYRSGQDLTIDVPETDPTAPWKNIRDPKKQDEARMRFGVAADARLAKEQEETSKAQSMIQSLDRFLYLNENNETGGKFKIPGAQTAATAFSPDYSEMKSLQDLMTPQMRQGMPGAASDRDVAMFRGATVGLDKQPEANRNIATGLKAANQNMVDRANFISQYITQKGHDRGADSDWKKYLDANPIFDPKSKPGSYKLNDNRVSFQEWISGVSPKDKAPSAPSLEDLLKKY